MIQRLVYLTAVTSMLAGGCVTELTPRGRQVQIAPLNVPRACRRLGKVAVSAEKTREIDVDDARNVMRNHAGEMGANMVRWDRIETDRVEGTAFRCPPKGRPARTARTTAPEPGPPSPARTRR